MVGIIEICENIEAPQHYTAKLLQVLTRNKLVSSQKGIHGGFYLTKEQLREPLISVVKAIDGPSLFTGCGLGLKHCNEKEPCPIHDEFKSVRNGIRKMLEETTIDKLGKKIKKGDSVLKSLKE
jgi:Rrf2 family protein